MSPNPDVAFARLTESLFGWAARRAWPLLAAYTGTLLALWVVDRLAYTGHLPWELWFWSTFGLVDVPISSTTAAILQLLLLGIIYLAIPGFLSLSGTPSKRRALLAIVPTAILLALLTAGAIMPWLLLDRRVSRIDFSTGYVVWSPEAVIVGLLALGIYLPSCYFLLRSAHPRRMLEALVIVLMAACFLELVLTFPAYLVTRTTLSGPFAFLLLPALFQWSAGFVAVVMGFYTLLGVFGLFIFASFRRRRQSTGHNAADTDRLLDPPDGQTVSPSYLKSARQLSVSVVLLTILSVFTTTRDLQRISSRNKALEHLAVVLVDELGSRTDYEELLGMLPLDTPETDNEVLRRAQRCEIELGEAQEITGFGEARVKLCAIEVLGGGDSPEEDQKELPWYRGPVASRVEFYPVDGSGLVRVSVDIEERTHRPTHDEVIQARLRLTRLAIRLGVGKPTQDSRGVFVQIESRLQPTPVEIPMSGMELPVHAGNLVLALFVVGIIVAIRSRVRQIDWSVRREPWLVIDAQGPAEVLIARSWNAVLAVSPSVVVGCVVFTRTRMIAADAADVSFPELALLGALVGVGSWAALGVLYALKEGRLARSRQQEKTQ